MKGVDFQCGETHAVSAHNEPFIGDKRLQSVKKRACSFLSVRDSTLNHLVT